MCPMTCWNVGPDADRRRSGPSTSLACEKREMMCFFSKSSISHFLSACLLWSSIKYSLF